MWASPLFCLLLSSDMYNENLNADLKQLNDQLTKAFLIPRIHRFQRLLSITEN